MLDTSQSHPSGTTHRTRRVRQVVPDGCALVVTERPIVSNSLFLEQHLYHRRDAVTIPHVVGESVVVISGETPRIVVGIDTIVVDTAT